jgi:hypothetical protein
MSRRGPRESDRARNAAQLIASIGAEHAVEFSVGGPTGRWKRRHAWIEGARDVHSENGSVLMHDGAVPRCSGAAR